MLTFWNTLSKQKEPFTAQHGKHVGMYNCGPTVYNYAHIGNLRSYVFADVLKRTLAYNKYKVTQVINITDVGHLTGDTDDGRDKIEEGARTENKTAKEITEFYTQEFLRDLAHLNIDTKGTLFPKATEHIAEQIALITTLEQKGFTYKTSDGIYFDTTKFKAYGNLGNIDLAHLQEGARVTINSEKKRMTDFALWKFSQPHEKRQQEWKSPWGVGFPGWHIECSAMSMKYLGNTFDIHTGGIDHIPVHHNNEIAQSESATGTQYVRYWLHNAFVNVEGGKMAKSEGNFLRLASIVEHGLSPLAYRYWLLTAHYRAQVLFSWPALESAATAYNKLVHIYGTLPLLGKINKQYLEIFKKHIDNDLDTPQAMATLWDMLKDQTISDRDKRATLNEFDKILGFDLKASAKTAKKSAKQLAQSIPTNVKKMAIDRDIARTQKDFKKADELRDMIQKAGFEVVDGEKGHQIRPLS